MKIICQLVLLFIVHISAVLASIILASIDVAVLAVVVIVAIIILVVISPIIRGTNRPISPLNKISVDFLRTLDVVRHIGITCWHLRSVQVFEFIRQRSVGAIVLPFLVMQYLELLPLILGGRHMRAYKVNQVTELGRPPCSASRRHDVERMGSELEIGGGGEDRPTRYRRCEDYDDK